MVTERDQLSERSAGRRARLSWRVWDEIVIPFVDGSVLLRHVVERPVR